MKITDSVKLIRVNGHFGELQKRIGAIGKIIQVEPNIEIQFEDGKTFHVFSSEIEVVTIK